MSTIENDNETVDWLVAALYVLGAATGTSLLIVIAVAIAAVFNHPDAGEWIRTAGSIFLVQVLLLNLIGFKLKRDGRLPDELTTAVLV